MPKLKSFQIQMGVGLLFLFVCQAFVTAHADAQTTSPQQENVERRRNIVMDFVHENHPQIEELLLALEKSKPGKFRLAIKRISKTVIRMKSFEDKQPDRYAALVELWKVKSEIEMLSARLVKQDDPELRAQLDALAEVFVDNRKQVLEFSKRNIQQRLDRTSRLLEAIETDRDAFVQKHLRSIDRTIKQLKSGTPVKN